MSLLDLLIIPINLDNMHWLCVAIWFKKKKIEYYDSMIGGDTRGLCRILLQYLQDDMKQYHHPSVIHEYDMSSWTISIRHDIPQQSNGYDCGVFICMYADYIIRNIELSEGIYATFTRQIVAEHMMTYRMHILLRILHYNRQPVKAHDIITQDDIENVTEYDGCMIIDDPHTAHHTEYNC